MSGPGTEAMASTPLGPVRTVPVLDLSSLAGSLPSAEKVCEPVQKVVENELEGVTSKEGAQIDSIREFESQLAFHSRENELHQEFVFPMIRYFQGIECLELLLSNDICEEVHQALSEVSEIQDPFTPIEWFKYSHGNHIFSSFYIHKNPVYIAPIDEPYSDIILEFKSIECLLMYRKCHLGGDPVRAELCRRASSAEARKLTQVEHFDMPNITEWDELVESIFMDCVARFLAVNPEMMVELIKTAGCMLTLLGSSRIWQSGGYDLPDRYEDLRSLNIHGKTLTLLRELVILQHTGRYTIEPYVLKPQCETGKIDLSCMPYVVQRTHYVRVSKRVEDFLCGYKVIYLPETGFKPWEMVRDTFIGWGPLNLGGRYRANPYPSLNRLASHV